MLSPKTMMTLSQEADDERAAQAWLRQPRSLEDYWRERTYWYQAHLFEAWRTLRGQSKGLQRQRRLIKRLQAELAAIKAK